MWTSVGSAATLVWGCVLWPLTALLFWRQEHEFKCFVQSKQEGGDVCGGKVEKNKIIKQTQLLPYAVNCNDAPIKVRNELHQTARLVLKLTKIAFHVVLWAGALTQWSGAAVNSNSSFFHLYPLAILMMSATSTLSIWHVQPVIEYLSALVKFATALISSESSLQVEDVSEEGRSHLVTITDQILLHLCFHPVDVLGFKQNPLLASAVFFHLK